MPADPCPLCRLPGGFGPGHCNLPGSALCVVRGYDLVVAERDEARAKQTAAEVQLVKLRAQLDRANLLLIKIRDAIDVALAALQQEAP